MADNVTLNSGSGGDTCGADDIGGVKFQRIKVIVGADGTNDGDVSSANPLPVGDAGGSLTVDGTVTVQDGGSTISVDDGSGSLTVDNATLSVTGGGVESGAIRVTLANDSTGLVSVDDNGSTLSVDDGGGSLTVDNAALAITGGGVESGALRVTIANDSTGVLSVDDNGSTLSIDDGGGNISIDDGGNSITVDGTVAVSGTVTVGSHAVTNAGTFAVQVDGSALTALQLLDNVVVVEDAAHGSGDSGVMALAVRRDANTTLVGTDGDYAPLQVNADGSLKVAITAGAGSGGTSLADDAAFTAASTSFTPVGGIVTSDSVDSGDGGAFAMLANRQQKITLYDSSGVEVSVGGGTQYDEDAAHSSGSKVTGCGIVRKDTAASLAGTDGDYTLPIADANGKLWVNAGGVTLTVDGSGVTQPVSHAALTELAAAINASSQMDVNIAASGATVPVSNAGLTALNGAISGSEVQVDIVGALPAGSNAIGKLAANTGVDIGDVDVTSVVPGTGATNLGKAEDAAHASGDVGVMAMTVRQDTAAALSGTDADYQPLITDGSGRLHVNVGNTVTVGSHAVTNAGTFAVQVDGSALTALQLIDDAIFADDAAFTAGSSKVSAAGFFADESSTDSVDEGDVGAARMTLDRKLITAPQPHSAGGLSIFRSLDLDETEEDVKTSAGCVYACWVTNTATSTRWIKFYNATAANVTVGSTTPVITIGIPGNSSDDISANLGPGGMGIMFDTAISVAATTGLADADTGAPAANDVVINVFYK